MFYRNHCFHFWLSWAVFRTMYQHVVEYLLLYCSTASTTQHSAVSPHKAVKHADQSAITQASRVGESPHIHVEHSYSTLSSQNERRNRNLPARPTKVYNYSHSAGVCAKGLLLVLISIRYNTALPLRLSYVLRTFMHPWSSG